MEFKEPDLCILHLSETIGRDAGLYSIRATNIAGSISYSVSVHIEEDEWRHSYLTYRTGPNVSMKSSNMRDRYDIGDEIGRGTQGIIYHAVERDTGRSYA